MLTEEMSQGPNLDRIVHGAIEQRKLSAS